MPAGIVPDTFVLLLGAFESCFSAPSYRNFGLLIAGWVHCLGRRTVTAVALTAGAVGRRHISTFHRFFGRAKWSLDAVGRVVFSLALDWLPAEAPLNQSQGETRRVAAVGSPAGEHAARPCDGRVA